MRTRGTQRTGRRFSQQDVAREAGVSQSTVSRVFTPGESVSPAIRAQVVAAAKKLNYHPNAIARSLVQGSTKLVGLVVTPFFNPFYARVIELFTEMLQGRGYWTMLLNVSDRVKADETLPVALRYKVDGIIIASATLTSWMTYEFVNSGTPVVLFNRYVAGANVNNVCCDDLEAGRMVADYLVDSNHRRFAFVSGGKDTSTDRDRERGFKEGLRNRGHLLGYREQGDDTYDSGCLAARNILNNQDDPPDAIFCANDLMACGVVDVCRKEFDVKVPDDLSVIGFDDIPMAGWSNYSLTTVRSNVEKMADEAIRVLVDAIERPEETVVTRRIAPTLIERDTSRRREI